MKKLSFVILLMTLCVSISKVTAQNKPFAINPDQVKNVYIGLIQNDSLKNRLIICEAAAVKFDSLIRASSKKTNVLIDEVKNLNSEADKQQKIINESVIKLDHYERFSPAWYVTCLVLGIAGGLYLGNL